MNIKKEFLSHLKTIKKNDNDVKCSIIIFVSYSNREEGKIKCKHLLKYVLSL